ncbi:MAG: tetratricopeptide repeat protein [Phycisphaerae bacterium]
MKRINNILLVTLVLAGLASLAAGQTVRGMDGRALDANYQIGSGRVNRRTPGYYSMRNNRYVTGQVTGLAGFRGRVPYRADNELRLDVPSARLEQFRQESVGLDQVRYGRPYETSLYLQRSRTVLGLPGITRGLNEPGSSQVRDMTPASMAARELYDDAVAGYRAFSSDEQQAILSLPVTQQLPDYQTRSSLTGRIDDGRERMIDQRLVTTPLYRTPETSLLAVPNAETRAELMQELAELQDEKTRPDENRTGAVTGLDPTDRERSLDPTRRQMDPSKRTDDPSQVADQRDERDKRDAKDTRTPDQKLLPQQGQDTFLDLLRKFRERKQKGEDETDEETPKEDRRDPIDLMGDEEKEGDSSEPLVVIKPNNTLLVKRLAGRNDDRFNRYMNRGEYNLKKGKFYTAVEEYKLASVAKPQNPMARVGLGLAFLGAGEPISSSMRFEKAIELFPPLIETRFNVTDMMDAATFRARLGALDKRLEKEPNPELLFLSAFLHASTGNRPKAKEYARALKDAEKANAVQKAYAQYLLTGEKQEAIDK